MKQLSVFEKFLEWCRHRIVQMLPESIKRLVLYELADRYQLTLPEADRDFWSVTCKDMYGTLRD